MYKIIIKELILHRIAQKNRVITKKQFVKIREIKGINESELSKTMIELKSKYKDFKYIIDFEKQ